MRRRDRKHQPTLDIGAVKRVRFRGTRRRMWLAWGTLCALAHNLNRRLGQMTPPQRDPDFEATPTKPVRVSVLSATLCLGVAALLVSGKIVEIADRLPLGADRDRWLSAAIETDDMSNALSLNRPYDVMLDLRGTGDELGQRIDVIADFSDFEQLMLAMLGPDADTSALAPAASSETGASTGGADGLAAPPQQPASDTPVDTGASSGATTAGQQGTQDPERAPALDAAQTPAQPDAQDPAATPDRPGAQDPAQDSAATTIGGADNTTPDAGSATTAATASVGAAGEAAAPTTTTTVPAEPVYVRGLPVSADAPLRTWVVGDSQAFYLGHGLQTHALADVLDVTLNQRHSTGLARPSYFNWPVHLYAVAVQHDPEVVVATLGSNDWQDLTAEDGRILSRGSAEWRAEWRRRLEVAFDVLEAPHRSVVWVGLPPTRSDEFREGYAVMNRVAASAAAERDFVTMIDIWDLFGGDEPYRDAVPPPDDPDGRPVDVRQADGVHLNRAGSEWVVDLIAAEIERTIAEINP